MTETHKPAMSVACWEIGDTPRTESNHPRAVNAAPSSTSSTAALASRRDLAAGVTGMDAPKCSQPTAAGKTR
jgi:hypothetical protein